MPGKIAEKLCYMYSLFLLQDSDDKCSRGKQKVEGSKGTLYFEKNMMGILVGVPKGLESLVPEVYKIQDLVEEMVVEWYCFIKFCFFLFLSF